MKDSFEDLAAKTTKWAGSTLATVSAFLIIIFWTIGGLFFGYGTDYQMIINSLTTVITFLMVFLIQRTQNKDSFAIHMKLNEIIAAHEGCSNRLINVEELSEHEIEKLHARYKKLSEKSRLEEGWTQKHTIEEIDD